MNGSEKEFFVYLRPQIHTGSALGSEQASVTAYMIPVKAARSLPSLLAPPQTQTAPNYTYLLTSKVQWFLAPPMFP